MKPVILHREALEEFDGAAAHYAQINPELSQRFYAAVDQAIREVRHSPKLFRFIHRPARRHLVRSFPYGVVYLERPRDVWIVAIMPLRRDPSYWKQRLPSR